MLGHNRSQELGQFSDQIVAVFDNYPEEKLEKIFVTLTACMKECAKVNGENTYKIPHTKIPRNRRFVAEEYILKYIIDT